MHKHHVLLCIYDIHSIPTLYAHHILHTPMIYHYTHIKHTMHILYTHCTHITCTIHIHCTHIIHTVHTCHTYRTYTEFTKTIHISHMLFYISHTHIHKVCTHGYVFMLLLECGSFDTTTLQFPALIPTMIPFIRVHSGLPF